MASSLGLGGCFGDRISAEELRAAIDAVVVLGQARQAVDDVVEISTSFTIGEGLEAIVEEVRAFLESQAPCTELTVGDSQITVDFGSLTDDCSYRGHTYGGQVVYSFELAGDEVHVTHDYIAFTNGEVTLDGGADVVWGGGARDIETDFTVTGEKVSLNARGDRRMTWVDPVQGLGGGVRIDGDHDWTGPLGHWTMSIDGVEARAQDPLPQAGSYELVTPRDVLATLSFSRVDDDTIEMVFEGPRQRRVYHVNSVGVVDEVDD